MKQNHFPSWIAVYYQRLGWRWRQSNSCSKSPWFTSKHSTPHGCCYSRPKSTFGIPPENKKNTNTWVKTSGFDRFRAVAKNEKGLNQFPNSVRLSRQQQKKITDTKRRSGRKQSWSRGNQLITFRWRWVDRLANRQATQTLWELLGVCMQGPFIQGCLFVNFKWVHR